MSIREEFDKWYEGYEAPWLPDQDIIADWWITTLKERIEKELRPCLDYCREQNGREDCKNCGLDEDTITRLLE